MKQILSVLLFFQAFNMFAQESLNGTSEMEKETERLFLDAQIQKAIGNLDRAVVLMEKAVRIDSLNEALNHELARLYLANDNKMLAEHYALKALNSGLYQYWYLNTFIKTIGYDSERMKNLAPNLPYEEDSFRIHLAKIYLEGQNPKAAIAFLDGVETNYSILQIRKQAGELLESQVQDQKPANNDLSSKDEEAVLEEDVKGLINIESWEEANKMALDAIEKFPLQPFFYFAVGKSFYAMQDINSAREWLEMGETILIEQDQLSEQIYALLAEIYLEQGNEAAYEAYKSKLN